MPTGYRRAAICIGVDRAAPSIPLSAAATGAASMAAWAREQGCDPVIEHTDSGVGATVHRRDILESITEVVDRRVFDQLIVYFAGHGLVMAPGTETWLLTDAATDSTEAVNVLLTAEHARRAGIPHVVFISDACRSYVSGPPFHGLTGGSVCPPATDHPSGTELDMYFATAPGDPAYEARSEWRPAYGLFTQCLLQILTAPPRNIVEYIDLDTCSQLGLPSTGPLPVLTSRRLREPLIDVVADHAAKLDRALDQRPEIRVETVLPRFLATVSTNGESGPADGGRTAAPPPRFNPSDLIRRGADANDFARRSRRLASEFLRGVTDLPGQSGDRAVSNDTDSSAWVVVQGISVLDIVATGWQVIERQDRDGQQQFRLVPVRGRRQRAASAVVMFSNRSGTVVPVVSGSSSTVVVTDGRVTAMDCANVNYAALLPGFRFSLRRQFAFRSRALAEITVAAQRGDLSPALDWPERFYGLLGRHRADPGSYELVTTNLVGNTLGAYAAAERGGIRTSIRPRREDYLLYLDEVGIATFDLALLASRAWDVTTRLVTENIFAQGQAHPFAPLLTRGWLLLADNPEPARPYHARLARHLIPALYTTLDPGGVDIALKVLDEVADS
ncbi:caspase family protein [Nocardia wallacei]|nr:caspase family protein [Nocardia wallacei]